MAYNAYNNFINPVRRPNSSLFPIGGARPVGHQVNYGYANNNIPPYQTNANQPRIASEIRQGGQMGPLTHSHHTNNSVDNVPPHLLSNNKRLELIKKDKDNLYQSLKENELLEQELISKSEKAIKLQQEREVKDIQNQVKILRKELEEKEALEKRLNEKQVKIQIEQERQELDKIRENKSYILDKINDQERHLIEMREKDELRRLEHEKELLTKKWQEAQLDEERKKQHELYERESRLKTEHERSKLESIEISRLRQETENLKDLLDHRSNQEEMLTKRINMDREREIAAEKIRRMKLEEKNRKLEELGSIQTGKLKGRHNGFRKKGIIRSTNSKLGSAGAVATDNTLENGYLSDTDGFGELDNILNEPIFKQNTEGIIVPGRSEPKSKAGNSQPGDNGVDINDYDLDKLDHLDQVDGRSLRSRMSLQTNKAIKPEKSQKDLVTRANSKSRSQSQAHSQSHSHHSQSQAHSEDYDQLMGKLIQDLESKQGRVKNKSQSEKISTMLQACKLMATLQEEEEPVVASDEEVEVYGDSIPKSISGQPIIPTSKSYTSEFDNDISDIHRQMSNIKGILKETNSQGGSQGASQGASQSKVTSK